MKQVNKELSEIFKSFNGNVLCIGTFEDSILNILKENNKILFCDLLNVNLSGRGKGKSKSKTISIKEFRKHYKKNNLNYIAVNIQDIKKYIPKFISTSIYIGNNKIYVYGTNDIYEIDRLSKKYMRYNCQIQKIEFENSYILEIDVSNAKNKIIMDKGYFIVDTLGLLADKISDLLMN